MIKFPIIAKIILLALAVIGAGIVYYHLHSQLSAITGAIERMAPLIGLITGIMMMSMIINMFTGFFTSIIPMFRW